MSEHGFTFTSDNVFGLPYSSVKGKPYITVSAKGLANGLSNIPNDGADFGPDSLRANGSATQTAGIQEAVNYIMSSPSGGKVKLSGGLFIINQTINIQGNSSGDMPIYIEGSGAGNFGNQTYPNTSESQGTLLYAGNGLNANMFYANNGGGYLKISDIHFFGNPDYNASPSGSSIAMITFNNGFQSEVSRCIFDNPPKNGYAIFSTYGNNLSYLNINKSLFQNAIAGITAQESGMIYLNPLSSGNQTSGAGPYIIEDCFFYNTANTHIFSVAPNTIIKSNYFEEFVNAINVGAINCKIVNNIIIGGGSSTSFYQIQTAGQNAVISNNFLLYAGYQNILVSGGSANIFGNLFDGSSGDSSTTAQTTYALNITVALASVSKGGCVFSDNYFNGPYASSYPFNYVSNTGLVIRNIYTSEGAHIILSPTTPSVPASGTALQNTNPYKVSFFVNGGTVTEIQITRGGTAYTVLSNSTGISLSSFPVTLEPGDSITLTYTTAPTWTDWMPD